MRSEKHQFSEQHGETEEGVSVSILDLSATQ